MGPGGLPMIIDLGVRARCYHSREVQWIEGGLSWGRLQIEYVSYTLLPRSSIGKTPLQLANSVGLIDRGYTGTLKVAVRNISDAAFAIGRGTSLFQLVTPSLTPANVEVVGPDHDAFTDDTLRGEGGFGSTGAGGVHGS